MTVGGLNLESRFDIIKETWRDYVGQSLIGVATAGLVGGTTGVLTDYILDLPGPTFAYAAGGAALGITISETSILFRKKPLYRLNEYAGFGDKLPE